MCDAAMAEASRTRSTFVPPLVFMAGCNVGYLDTGREFVRRVSAELFPHSVVVASTGYMIFERVRSRAASHSRAQCFEYLTGPSSRSLHPIKYGDLVIACDGVEGWRAVLSTTTAYGSDVAHPLLGERTESYDVISTDLFQFEMRSA